MLFRNLNVFLNEKRPEVSLKLLLIGMSKDLELKSAERTKQERHHLHILSEHKKNFHILIRTFLQRLLPQTSMSNLNSRNINSIVETPNKNPKIARNVEHHKEPKRTSHGEEEFERSQSPYSIALVPELDLKITKRPPRPHLLSHCRTMTPTNTEQSQQSPLTSLPSQGVAGDNERKKEVIKDSSCKSETFITFPVRGQNEKNLQTTFTVRKVGAATESTDCLCSNSSLPSPVLVSDESKKSQTQFKCYPNETRSSDINNKKNSEFFTVQSSRALSPSIKSVGDQTAKAALIRTLITERLNSCSPLSWQT